MQKNISKMMQDKKFYEKRVRFISKTYKKSDK